jgi:hypothetical protein
MSLREIAPFWDVQGYFVDFCLYWKGCEDCFPKDVQVCMAPAVRPCAIGSLNSFGFL